MRRILLNPSYRQYRLWIVPPLPSGSGGQGVRLRRASLLPRNRRRTFPLALAVAALLLQAPRLGGPRRPGLLARRLLSQALAQQLGEALGGGLAVRRLGAMLLRRDVEDAVLG